MASGSVAFGSLQVEHHGQSSGQGRLLNSCRWEAKKKRIGSSCPTQWTSMTYLPPTGPHSLKILAFKSTTGWWPSLLFKHWGALAQTTAPRNTTWQYTLMTEYSGGREKHSCISSVFSSSGSIRIFHYQPWSLQLSALILIFFFWPLFPLPPISFFMDQSSSRPPVFFSLAPSLSFVPSLHLSLCFLFPCFSYLL